MWQYILISCIPGIINVANAYTQLYEDCKVLPFFNPLKSLGFWAWALAQFSFPAVIFWFSFIDVDTAIDFELIRNAIVFGTGFIAVLNGKTEIISLNIDVGSYYRSFVQFAHRRIIKEEKLRTANFWQDLKKELTEKSEKGKIDIEDLYKFIQEYKQIDLESEVKSGSLSEQSSELTGRIEILKTEIKVHVTRSDLPKILVEWD